MIIAFVKRNSVPIAALCLIGAGVLAFVNSFSGAFIFDDIKAIVLNPNIQKLRPLRAALHSPPDTTLRDRPVVSITLVINYALGGLDVWGYHAFNLTIHILAGLVLFGIIRRTLVSDTLKERYGRASLWLALSASLLWLVHPLQTESVTYTIQRSESLCGLFYLLTLYCFIRGAGSSPRKNFWYAASVISCALGMGTKAVMATAPVMLLIYDWIFVSRSFKKAIDNHGVFYAALAGTWIIQLMLLYKTPYYDIEGLNPLNYGVTQFGTILYLLKLTFWPHALCLDYGWPVATDVMTALLPAIPLLLLLGAIAYALQRRPALGFIGVWFFLILAPTSTILPLEDLAFEHRMYLPLAGVLTLVVIGFHELLVKIKSERLRCAAGLFLALTSSFTLGYLTFRRNQDYHSALVMWSDVVAKRPNHARGHYNLGWELDRRGRLEEAVPHYEEAIRLKPAYPEAHNNLGIAFLKERELDKAIEHFTEALRSKSDYPGTRHNMGIALALQGRNRDAIICFRKAIKAQPESPEPRWHLAKLLFKTGEIKEAISCYRELIKIKPEHIEAHFELGMALATSGKPQEAIEDFQTVLKYKPDYQPAREAIRKLEVFGSQTGQSAGTD